MKILLGVIIGVAVLSFLLSENTAHGIWVPESPQELFNNSDTIFVGNITSANTLQLEKQFSYITEENGTDKNFVQNYTIPLDQYQVNVEEFLKNPQNSSKMTVRQPTISAGPGPLIGFDKFNVGDHVLFYVGHMDGNNTYSPESFVIPEYCAGKDVLTQERFEMGNEFFSLQNGNRIDSNFTANVPIQFVWNRDVGTLAGKNFDVLVYMTKSVGTGAQIVFNKEIHVESKPCQWIASAKWEFTPQEGKYGMDIRIRENGTISHLSDSGFSVKSNVMTPNNASPLKQFKSGIAAKDVKCKEGLQLVIKTKDGSPVCIKPDNAYILINRGWAKEFIQIVTWTNQSTCEGTRIPSGNYRGNIFPVLIMSPNSNATVCVTYNFMSDWQSYHNKDVYPHGILETCCFVHPGWYSSTAPSNKFEILANPPLFNVTGVMNNSKVSVTYKIYAKSDSNGFYDTSVPFDGCLSYPLAVGHDPSEIDATKFHADFTIPCFATIDDVDSVNIVSGMTYKEVQFP